MFVVSRPPLTARVISFGGSAHKGARVRVNPSNELCVKGLLSYGQGLGYSPYDAGANITVCSDAAQRDAVLAKQHLQFGLSSKLTRGGAASSLPQPL